MELFKIKHFDAHYYFTSYKEDITVGGIVYKAIPITRKEITRSLDDNGLKITAPLTIAPFNKMFVQTVSSLSEIEIIRYPENITLYKGNVLKTTLDYQKETIDIAIAQHIMLGNNEFPNRSYSASCGYNFGDEYCKVNKENYSIIVSSSDFTINNDGSVISSSAFSSVSYLKGGYLVADSKYYSYIIEQNGSALTLLTALPSPLSILSVTVTPSCPKSLEACSYYNNLSHFGGFPYIPDNNLTTGGF